MYRITQQERQVSLIYYAEAEAAAFAEKMATEHPGEEYWVQGRADVILGEWTDVSCWRDDSPGGSIKAGDILSASWGYDQTNVDWYRVTKRTGSRVYLQRLQGIETETGFMCGTSVPGEPTSAAPFYRKVKDGYAAGQAESVKINSYTWAYKWDGRPGRASWYA